MSKTKRKAVCGLVCAALILGGAAGVLTWGDRQYAHRLAQETRLRYDGGVLQGDDFEPLSGAESVVLFQRAVSPMTLLSTAPDRAEDVLVPYLPDFGSGLCLEEEGGQWLISYQTLDGLEVSARYSLAGQQALVVYHPGPDLEVRMEGENLACTLHARRGVTLWGLWSALTAELKYRM